MARLNAGAALLVLAVVGALFAASAAWAEEVGDFVLPSSKAASAERCVEPTEFMRRSHYEVIRHQRDTTVYGGVRSTKHSLAGCVGCHVGYDNESQPVAVNDEGQFCNACHEYAAVTMNCFDCHATVPEGEGWNHEIAAMHAHTGAQVASTVPAAQPAGEPGQQLGEQK
jgi:hypothetical protein